MKNLFSLLVVLLLLTVAFEAQSQLFYKITHRRVNDSDWAGTSGVVTINDDRIYISESGQNANITTFTETQTVSEDNHGVTVSQWEGSIECGGVRQSCLVSIKYFEDGERKLYLFFENENWITYHLI